MNKTKKITQGAMLLAIVGALMMIDRMLAFSFSEFVILAIPVVIIIYIAMYSFSDGFVLTVGLLAIGLLLGDLYYYMYLPIGIVSGLAYGFCLSRNMSSRVMMIVAIIAFVIGEMIVSLFVGPLLGFDIIKEELVLMTSIFEGSFNQAAQSGMAVPIDSAALNKLILVCVISAIILAAVLEGVLIHLLSVFLLKRFKIKEVKVRSLYEFKPHPVIAYLGLALTSLSFFAMNFKDDRLFYVLVALSVIGSVILLYFGYVFGLLFGKLVLNKNFAFLLVLATIFMSVPLMVVGFLYGSGPLRNYLDEEVKKRYETHS